MALKSQSKNIALAIKTTFESPRVPLRLCHHLSTLEQPIGLKLRIISTNGFENISAEYFGKTWDLTNLLLSLLPDQNP